MVGTRMLIAPRARMIGRALEIRGESVCVCGRCYQDGSIRRQFCVMDRIIHTLRNATKIFPNAFMMQNHLAFEGSSTSRQSFVVLQERVSGDAFPTRDGWTIELSMSNVIGHVDYQRRLRAPRAQPSTALCLVTADCPYVNLTATLHHLVHHATDQHQYADF